MSCISSPGRSVLNHNSQPDRLSQRDVAISGKDVKSLSLSLTAGCKRLLVNMAISLCKKVESHPCLGWSCRDPS